MKALYRAVLWFFIWPGEVVCNRLNVAREENRDLVRMLVNSLFWIGVAVIGLAIWTSTLPMYQ